MGMKDDYEPVDVAPRRLKDQGVSLGCGTLILIALIVMFFSGRGVGDVKDEVRRLQSEVNQLRSSVELQTTAIRALEQKLDERIPALTSGF